MDAYRDYPREPEPLLHRTPSWDQVAGWYALSGIPMLGLGALALLKIRGTPFLSFVPLQPLGTWIALHLATRKKTTKLSIEMLQELKVRGTTTIGATAVAEVFSPTTLQGVVVAPAELLPSESARALPVTVLAWERGQVYWNVMWLLLSAITGGLFAFAGNLFHQYSASLFPTESPGLIVGVIVVFVVYAWVSLVRVGRIARGVRCDRDGLILPGLLKDRHIGRDQGNFTVQRSGRAVRLRSDRWLVAVTLQTAGGRGEGDASLLENALQRVFVERADDAPSEARRELATENSEP